MPSPTTTNVLVGEARGYTAPVGTTAPLDTLATGATWLSPWTYWGGTEEGLSMGVGTTTQDINIEEQSNPVLITVQNRNIRFIVTLSEDTLETMKLAFGASGTIATQAAATGVIGKKTLTLAEGITPIMAGFEGVGVEGFWHRVIIPRVVSIADVTTAYRRATNNRSYAIELRAICPVADISIARMTAVAL